MLWLIVAEEDKKTCSYAEFRCENGPCIPRRKRCDGRIDCPLDPSDELDCCKLQNSEESQITTHNQHNELTPGRILTVMHTVLNIHRKISVWSQIHKYKQERLILCPSPSLFRCFVFCWQLLYKIFLLTSQMVMTFISVMWYHIL